MLNSVGEIDFGVSEVDDRFWSSNVRDVRIRRGEVVTITEGSGVLLNKIAILGDREID